MSEADAKMAVKMEDKIAADKAEEKKQAEEKEKET